MSIAEAGISDPKWELVRLDEDIESAVMVDLLPGAETTMLAGSNSPRAAVSRTIVEVLPGIGVVLGSTFMLLMGVTTLTNSEPTLGVSAWTTAENTVTAKARLNGSLVTEIKGLFRLSFMQGHVGLIEEWTATCTSFGLSVDHGIAELRLCRAVVFLSSLNTQALVRQV